MFAVVLVHSDPFLQASCSLFGEKGGATTQVWKTYSSVCEADPATLAYSCASLCQDSCIMSGWRSDAIHSPGVHRYCRWCWDACARSPVSLSLCHSSFPFQSQIKDKHRSFSSRSDPEVVVTHVCFLGCLTWEQSRRKARLRFTLRITQTRLKEEESRKGK